MVLAEELRRIPGPMEFLSLEDGESVTLRIVSWDRGTAVIYSKIPPPPKEKEIVVLRVHLAAEVKPYFPYYYDISSKTLQAQLLPMFMERGFERYTYVIAKHGVAPKARYTVKRVPL